MFINQSTCLIAVMSCLATVLNSCGYSGSAPNQRVTHYDNINNSLNPPSNAIKVLNSVTCSNGCINQDQVNAIWKECLIQGYIESSPQINVIHSREIKEIVKTRFTYYSTQNYSVPTTNPDGIVTGSNHSRQISQTIDLQGQCIGSEYILK